MSTRLLLLEDDPAIARTVAYALERDGLQVTHCLLVQDARQQMQRHPFDLLVLDVGLPDGSGFDVCRELRGFSDVPVIFLTARNDEIDRVLGLELGADDYVTKPFSPRELVARVRARLRRAGAVPAASPVSADPWVMRGAFAIDREGHRIRYRQQLLDLTRYEYAVLDALLQRPGAILSRAQLMDRGWDSDADSADRTVDTHVKTLRAKLRAAGADPDPIRTHRGLGYAVEA